MRSMVEGVTVYQDNPNRLCKALVWRQPYEQMYDAIARKKQIKAGSRTRKLALIEQFNPDWKDLCESLA